MAESEQSNNWLFARKTGIGRFALWFGRVCLLWLTLFGCIRLFTELFPLERSLDFLLLGAGLFVISMLVGCLYLLPKGAGLVVFGVWILAGYLVLKNWQWVVSGVLTLADAVSAQINLYYLTTFIYWKPEPIQMEYFFWLLATPIAAVLGRWIFRNVQPFLVLAIWLIMIAGGLVTGRSPGIDVAIAGVFLYFALRGLKSAENRRGNVRGPGLESALIAGILALLLFMAAGLFEGPIQAGLDRYKQPLRDFQDRLLKGEGFLPDPENANGGLKYPSKILEEKLSNQAPVFMNKKVLRLTLGDRILDTIYLRGFVGADYMGSRWQSEDPALFVARWKDRNIELLQLGYYARSSLGSPVSLSVRNIGSSPYNYLPYFVKLPRGTETYLDASVLGNSQTMEYTGYPGSSHMFESIDPSDNPYAELELEYRDYVYERYLDIPASLHSIRKTDKRLFENLGGQDAALETYEEAISIVSDILKDFRYSRDLNPLPEGEDYILDFLGQKTGFCQHFATVSVMLFRCLGIPARYASGYVVTDTARGYSRSFDVTDYCAHAWTEIYINGMGWSVVDMTPASEDNPIYWTEWHSAVAEDSNNRDLSSLSREESRRPEFDPQNSRPSGGEHSGKETSTGEPSFFSSLPWKEILTVTLIVLLLAGIVFTICYRQRYLGRKRNYPGILPDYREAIRKLAIDLFRALRLSGLGTGKQGDYEVLMQITDVRQRKDAEVFAEKMEQAYYGGLPMGIKDYQDALTAYYGILRIEMHYWNLPKRLWAKWIRCWIT